MPEAPLLPHTPLQRQIAQMALDLAIKLEEKAGQAPLGGVLDACEALLRDSLAGHPPAHRLGYALRLRQGLPIGSGLIEGACKQMIGRRMKQTSAQWDVRNADRMALLCSLAYSDNMPLYFTSA